MLRSLSVVCKAYSGPSPPFSVDHLPLARSCGARHRDWHWFSQWHAQITRAMPTRLQRIEQHQHVTVNAAVVAGRHRKTAAAALSKHTRTYTYIWHECQYYWRWLYVIQITYNLKRRTNNNIKIMRGANNFAISILYISHIIINHKYEYNNATYT